MSISVLGICGLEWHLIARSVEEAEAKFDQSAIRAMYATVSDLENAETDVLIAKEIGPKPVIQSSREMGYQYSLNKRKYEGDFVLTEIESFKIGFNRRINDSNQALSVLDEPDIPRETETSETVCLETSFEDGRIDSSIPIGLVTRKMEVIETAMQKVLLEEMQAQPNLKSRIGDTNLDSLLSANFSREGIDLPFAYFVKGAERFSDLNVDIGEITNAKAGAMIFSVPLFPNFPDEFTLLVGFPSKQVFVIKHLGSLLLLVLLFSLLILVTYVKTHYTMLKQKGLSEVKSDFINNMRHEFKTPLATIRLALDSINHPSVHANPSEISRLTGIISEESRRLNVHVEKILQVAKMEKGELKLSKSWFDLAALLYDVKSSMDMRVLSRNGLLSIDVSDLSVKVFADETHLRTVLLNLVDNALKYSESNPIVTISCKIESNFIRIAVTDKGMGMNHKIQRKAFETFYRAQSGNLHNVKGFGLGLSYMREVVHLHSGEILLNSQVGKGTSIGFKIPLIHD